MNDIKDKIRRISSFILPERWGRKKPLWVIRAKKKGLGSRKTRAMGSIGKNMQ